MRVTIGAVGDVIAGIGFPERLQGRLRGKYPFFKVGDISRAWKAGSKYLVEAEHYVDDPDLTDLRATPIPAGATVFAKIGAAVALNRRAILSQPSLIDNNCFAVLPDQAAIDQQFLFYFLCGVDFGRKTRATTVPSLRKGDVEEVEIPDFSLPEQRRIVAAIETHFSRLDAAVASLTRARASVKRARASVLKAAVEGRLVPTEAALARADGRDYEPASALLERILTDRKTAWAAAGAKGKYKEPAKPDTTSLPDLPEGWVWATVDELAVEIRNGYSGKPSDDGSLPILRISAVRPRKVDISDVRYLPASTTKFAAAIAQAGDLLVTRYNGSREFVGVMGMIRGVSTIIHPDKLIRVRPVDTAETAPWLETAFNVASSRQFIESRVRTTAGQAGISGSDLKATPVPLPPLAEQRRIVAEVDRRLSVLDALEGALEANLARCGRLRQAILKRAFEGRLVPAEGAAASEDKSFYLMPEAPA